jgi:hypothetical protein
MMRMKRSQMSMLYLIFVTMEKMLLNYTRNVVASLLKNLKDMIFHLSIVMMIFLPCLVSIFHQLPQAASILSYLTIPIEKSQQTT